MQRYEYKSDFARTYYRQGFEEGFQAGWEQAREKQEARQQGLVEGWRTGLLAFAQGRLKTIPADHLAKIMAITELADLVDLLMSLARTRTAFGARRLLARRLNR